MKANIFVSGFVQGVGFRRFVRRMAKIHGLQGWVKNLPDGRVEATFSGEKEIIEKVIEKLWEGPYFSDVKNIDVEWSDGTEEEFIEFTILK